VAFDNKAPYAWSGLVPPGGIFFLCAVGSNQ